jgi:RNA polymerase subunit RPABC4/transcription elongation factor Spt4
MSTENSLPGYGTITRRKRLSCTNCSRFELTKQYTGAAGTQAEDTYEELDQFEECPVCGGQIDSEVIE